MSRVALDLGFIQIYWYSICILLGVLAGSIYIFREAKKQKIEETFITNIIFYGVLVGIVGARLYYCIFNWSYYSKHLLEIFEIWNGGLAIHGGIIAGFIVVLLCSKKYKLKIFRITDVLAPGLLIGQAIGRWGNFFNKEAFGQATTLEGLKKIGAPQFVIDGMYINGTYYQPTFLYESIWNFFGFIAILMFKRYPYLKHGQLTGFYLMWYSFGRFIVESFRSDSLMLGPLKVAQVVSVILFFVGLAIILLGKRGSKFEGLYREVEGEEKK